MTDREKLDGMRKDLQMVINYPTKKQGRRTKDGFPAEITYDEFAYKRMVNSFREALKTILEEFDDTDNN